MNIDRDKFEDPLATGDAFPLQWYELCSHCNTTILITLPGLKCRKLAPTGTVEG